MSRRRPTARCLVAATALTAAAPALAAPTYTFGGTVDGRIGLGSNPALNSTRNPTTGLVGVNVNAVLSRATTFGSTTLTGTVDLEQNFKYYGFLDNYTVGLSHVQRLSERLTVSGSAGYQNTINRRGDLGAATGFYAPVTTTPVVTVPTETAAPATDTIAPILPAGPTLTYDPASIDYLGIGQRSQRVYGSLGLGWQPGERDTFNVGGNASRAIYSRGFASRYVQYGANAGYLRTLSANTRLGVQGSVQKIESGRYSNATSYQVGLQGEQRINANWYFSGTLGILFQRQDPFTDGAVVVPRTNNTTLAFSASLCGTYVRTNACLTASRQSAPSGIGGLRTDTNFGANVTRAFTERSRGSLSLGYDRSGANDSLTPRQNFFSARASYSRDIAPRLALGASGGYQRRTFGGYRALAGLPAIPASNLNSYQATGDIIYRWGRFR